jgi:cytochrome c553
MKRAVWTIGLLFLAAGCWEDDNVTTQTLTGEALAISDRIAGIDPIAGKDVATWCAGCHGEDGISADSSIPHLSDQIAYYLFAQIRAFREGERTSATMETVAQSLGEEAMMKVAAYYASLEPPEPAVDPAESDGAKLDGAVGVGRELAEDCAGCHGDDGNSDIEGMPGLAGHHPADMLASMQAYKDGTRIHSDMESILEDYSQEDLYNMALFYAVQKPRRTQAELVGDPIAGRKTAAACAACHGADGNASDPNTPGLAGEDPEYLVTATKAYRNGMRNYLMMKHPVESLSDQDIEDLAAFYASQEPRAAPLNRPLTTAGWVDRCNRCHGVDGRSSDPRFPRIAAQRKEYLQQALAAYREETRGNSMMRAMTATLSETEMADIAAYYAGQPRVGEMASSEKVEQ